MNPADEFKDLLVAAGVVAEGASSGWIVFVGKMVDRTGVPDTAVALLNSGGEPSNPKWLLDYPHVQARVRGSANGYLAAYNKVVEVKDVLLGLNSQDGNDGRIVSVTAIGDINPLGFDSNDRPEFSMNFSLIVEPNPSALTNREAL